MKKTHKKRVKRGTKRDTSGDRKFSKLSTAYGPAYDKRMLRKFGE